jgi:hypothetical protein
MQRLAHEKIREFASGTMLWEEGWDTIEGHPVSWSFDSVVKGRVIVVVEPRQGSRSALKNVTMTTLRPPES